MAVGLNCALIKNPTRSIHVIHPASALNQVLTLGPKSYIGPISDKKIDQGLKVSRSQGLKVSRSQGLKV